jgi:hypothetical protein
VTHTQRPDKRRTPIDGRAVTFKLQEAGFIPPFKQVTSVSVIPFTTDGGIVATVEKRGPDFPGGHVAVGEKSCEETARRESLEEAGITLGELQLVRAIESDLYGSSKEELTYMVIMTGLVSEILDEPEEAQRLFLTQSQFKQQHSALKRELMEQLVDEAAGMLFGASDRFKP